MPLYVKLGDNAAARAHYLAGRKYLHVLADDDYGARLRKGFDRYEALHPEQVAPD